ncbi:DNA-processing protein DprA [Stigmatella aurantiaca]|uniref:SMF family protein n=1 Tax=Stigmatella aurantiaca (strain DW4/3-1) TaxID=378806 RepID=Q08Q70_STIAD|nr:DNA-processing protein DprA [Stigmatella aurantiaca]ADO72881.1 SMF family protein [Stigmatella aurantiaca DW4/3-1]EAU62625.1 topoisomerase [Stigmatella aurantiaca DW4/3-1]
MAHTLSHILSADQCATLALWSVPGLGPKTLEALRAFAGGHLGALASRPVREWAGQAPVSGPVRQRLASGEDLPLLAERTLARCAASGVEVAFSGAPGYPERLVGTPDAPPLLFYKGHVGPPRRRVAMVGSRHPEQGFLPYARDFARQVAEGGVGVVSGAAMGVDRACHWGALDAGGETWAFLGSALDELDPPQARLLPHFLERGGVFFSELPPGVRASRSTFPRRNRLIAGASDAVVVMRAGKDSGALYTAVAGEALGRPVLALPGDVRNEAAVGCNGLIQQGRARACLSVKDVWEFVGARPVLAVPPGTGEGWEVLSAEAKGAYEVLDRVPRTFEEVLAAVRLSPAALASALVELELSGLLIQHPGRLFERI